MRMDANRIVFPAPWGASPGSEPEAEEDWGTWPKGGQAFQSITLGHMRSHGCRDLLSCEAINCHHRIRNADHLPDDLPIHFLGSRMVCARCGHGGADVRPD
jgi:hypothetical protein